MTCDRIRDSKTSSPLSRGEIDACVFPFPTTRPIAAMSFPNKSRKYGLDSLLPSLDSPVAPHNSPWRLLPAPLREHPYVPFFLTRSRSGTRVPLPPHGHIHLSLRVTSRVTWFLRNNKNLLPPSHSLTRCSSNMASTSKAPKLQLRPITKKRKRTQSDDVLPPQKRYKATLPFGQSRWDYLPDLIQDYIQDLAARSHHRDKMKQVWHFFTGSSCKHFLWIIFNSKCYNCNHCQRYRRYGTIDDMICQLRSHPHPHPARWTNAYCDECQLDKINEI